MHLDQQYYVYILASSLGGTLYIGMTNDLLRRVQEHREGLVPGFTSQHGVHRLVYLRFLKMWKPQFSERNA